MLMREAAKVNDWKLNNAGIAAMWRGGCIIKVGLLLHAYVHADVHVECLLVRHHQGLPREPRARELVDFRLLPQGCLQGSTRMEAMYRSIYVSCQKARLRSES
jgi:hypothetical protein